MERPCAISIWSSVFLSKELNILKKSMNSSVASIFFADTSSIITRIVRIYEDAEDFFVSHCDFSKNFQEFGLDTMEKFWRKEKDVIFRSFLYFVFCLVWFGFLAVLHDRRRYHQIFCLPNFRGHFIEAWSFSAFNFFNNCLSLPPQIFQVWRLISHN